MVASVRNYGTVVGGLGDTVVPLPVHVAGDVLAILVGCDTDTIAAPAGWTIHHKIFVTGTALALIIKDAYAASGAEANPTILDPGNHVVAQAISLQDCDKTPHRVGGCSTQGSQTVGRTPSARTAMDDQFIMCALLSGLDSLGPICSAVANTDITGFAETSDAGTDEGNGSVIVIATGTVAAPANIKPSEFTITAGNTVGMLISWMPKPAVAYTGVADGAADGAVVNISDETQGDVVFTGVVAGGAGAYSVLVRFADHVYRASCDNTTTRGASSAAVP